MKELFAARSAICGDGMFVRQNVRKGELICYIKGTMKHKVNKTVHDSLSNPDWIGISRHKWIDPAMPYKRLNHSCNPNTGIKGAVSLYALRTITAGEELTIDYSTIEGDPQWQLEGGMSCKCGAKNCRKKISSIQSLPPQRFKAYLPYISTYFQELYRKAQRKPS